MIRLIALFLMVGTAHAFIESDLSPVSNATINPKVDKRLVVFWASWCTTCRGKLKNTLPKFQNDRKDVQVLTVNIDEERERAQAYVKKHQITLPVFHDEKKKLQDELKVVGVPHWAVYRKVGQNWKLKKSKVTFDLDEIKSELN